jgi:rare lipoprotein A
MSRVGAGLRGAVLITSVLMSSAHARIFDDSCLVTWYGTRFHGRTMANGDRFDMNDPNIVAHRTLPFGTRIRFTNPDTGATLVAVVQDRGPYSRADFDLSRAGAEALGVKEEGVARLEFHVLPRR